jgi:hypothetical protein
MSKEIPKKKGQGLNGTGVSLAALVFLLVAVPVASTYLVDLAIYFGGDEVELNSAEVVNQDGPIWTNTGAGDASICSGNDVDSLDICPSTINTASPNPVYFNGDRYHELPGCENYTQQPKPYGAGGFCGSDDYDLYVNLTNFMIQNRTFPIIELNFVGSVTYLCDPLNFGDSKIDYELNIKRYSPISGTSIYTSDQRLTLSGVMEFDNGGIYDYEPTDMCNPTINVKHVLDFSELENLEEIRKEFFDNGNDLIYLTIQLDNLRTDSDTPYDYTDYYSPFQGPTLEPSYFNVKTPTYEVDAVNFTLRVGVLTLGIGFWLIALASTPLWNPTKARLFG